MRLSVRGDRGGTGVLMRSFRRKARGASVARVVSPSVAASGSRSCCFDGKGFSFLCRAPKTPRVRARTLPPALGSAVRVLGLGRGRGGSGRGGGADACAAGEVRGEDAG